MLHSCHFQLRRVHDPREGVAARGQNQWRLSWIFSALLPQALLSSRADAIVAADRRASTRAIEAALKSNPANASH